MEREGQDKPDNATLIYPRVRPTHVQVEEALYILMDQLQSGDRLPPEPELAKRLGVSRATLREVMRTFEERELVIRKHGVGTFVAPRIPPLESGLEMLESIDSLASRKGMETEVTRLRVEERQATEKELAGLQISESTEVLAVSRTISIQDKPVAYLVDVVPTKYLSSSDLGKDFHGSVLDLFLDRGKPSLAYSWTNITAKGASRELSSLLEIRRGTALIKIEAQLFSVEEDVVDYSISYFVPGHFQFHVIRRIPKRGLENGGSR